MTKFRIVMLIRCFLQAWDKVAARKKEAFLLYHASTISHYKDDPDFAMQSIFAIEAFICESKQSESWSSELLFKRDEFKRVSN